MKQFSVQQVDGSGNVVAKTDETGELRESISPPMVVPTPEDVYSGASATELMGNPSGPVEVGGRDVRTLPIPGTEESRGERGEQRVDLPARPTLDVAVERYGNLDQSVVTFVTKLDSWVVGNEELQAAHDDVVAQLDAAWGAVGSHLRVLCARGVVVKRTMRSRREAWQRPGAWVDLRPDVRKRFEAHYESSVLDSLTIKHAMDKDVFLVSGEREIGLVPRAHIMKRQRGKSEDSTAK